MERISPDYGASGERTDIILFLDNSNLTIFPGVQWWKQIIKYIFQCYNPRNWYNRLKLIDWRQINGFKLRIKWIKERKQMKYSGLYTKR